MLIVAGARQSASESPGVETGVGDEVEEGDLIGWVIPVLKQDKGKVPSTSMLHLELYTEYNGEWVLWPVGAEQPSNLLNPTSLLQRQTISWRLDRAKMERRF